MPDRTESTRPLPHSELMQLKRWNTPTIYNGWEQITKREPAADAFNIEETRDFMPQMGPMVGYAVTVVIEPGNAAHRAAKSICRPPASVPTKRRFEPAQHREEGETAHRCAPVSITSLRASLCADT